MPTKLEIVKRVAALTESTQKHAEEVAEALFSVIGEAVAEHGRFMWPGFGTWRRRSRKARRISNPITHELMRLPRTKSVGFRPSKHLNAKVRK
jgi:DNA-binding protein HU-beta